MSGYATNDTPEPSRCRSLLIASQRLTDARRGKRVDWLRPDSEPGDGRVRGRAGASIP
jgi:hypothetical protein